MNPLLSILSNPTAVPGVPKPQGTVGLGGAEAQGASPGILGVIGNGSFLELLASTQLTENSDGQLLSNGNLLFAIDSAKEDSETPDLLNALQRLLAGNPISEEERNQLLSLLQNEQLPQAVEKAITPLLINTGELSNEEFAALQNKVEAALKGDGAQEALTRVSESFNDVSKPIITPDNPAPRKEVQRLPHENVFIPGLKKANADNAAQTAIQNQAVTQSKATAQSQATEQANAATQNKNTADLVATSATDSKLAQNIAANPDNNKELAKEQNAAKNAAQLAAVKSIIENYTGEAKPANSFIDKNTISQAINAYANKSDGTVQPFAGALKNGGDAEGITHNTPAFNKAGVDTSATLSAAASDASKLAGSPSTTAVAAKNPVPNFLSHHPTAVDQISVRISEALSNGNNRINIQLQPEMLGKVEVNIEVNHHSGKAHIVVAAEKSETLEMLRGDSRSLERALNDAGIKTNGSNLSFDLRDGNSAPWKQQAGEGGGSNHANNYEQIDPAYGKEIEELVRQYSYTGDSALDIRV